jgi:hypothetical protein
MKAITQKTEKKLDNFRQDLVEYENLILKKHATTAELADIDKKLTALRFRLISSKSEDGAPFQMATAKKTNGSHKDAQSVLAGLDPRIQKSLGATIKALTKHGGSAHVEQLAKTMGISKKAAMLRASRGVKLGIIKRIDKGTYGAK